MSDNQDSTDEVRDSRSRENEGLKEQRYLLQTLQERERADETFRFHREGSRERHEKKQERDKLDKLVVAESLLVLEKLETLRKARSLHPHLVTDIPTNFELSYSSSCGPDFKPTENSWKAPKCSFTVGDGTARSLSR